MRSWGVICVCILAASTLAVAEAQSLNMDKKACLGADWRALGEQDGKFGHTDEALAIRAKNCSRHKATPDTAAYAEGRTVGLVVFCTPETALEAGASGKGNAVVCGPDASAVQAAFKSGQEFRKAKSAYESQQSTYNSRVSHINFIRAEIRKFQSDYNSTTDAGLRNKRMGQIQDRQKDLSRAETDAQFFQSRLLDAELEYRSAQTVFAAVKAEIKAKSMETKLNAPPSTAATASPAVADPAAPATAAPAAPAAGAGP